MNGRIFRRVRGQKIFEEHKKLHRKVTGSVNNSELCWKYRDGYEKMHVNWWRDPTTNEVHRGVNSFLRIDSDSESDVLE